MSSSACDTGAESKQSSSLFCGMPAKISFISDNYCRLISAIALCLHILSTYLNSAYYVHVQTLRLVLVLICFIYALAFYSLYVQVDALIEPVQGILPVDEYLPFLKEKFQKIKLRRTRKEEDIHQEDLANKQQDNNQQHQHEQREGGEVRQRRGGELSSPLPPPPSTVWTYVQILQQRLLYFFLSSPFSAETYRALIAPTEIPSSSSSFLVCWRQSAGRVVAHHPLTSRPLLPSSLQSTYHACPLPRPFAKSAVLGLQERFFGVLAAPPAVSGDQPVKGGSQQPKKKKTTKQKTSQNLTEAQKLAAARRSFKAAQAKGTETVTPSEDKELLQWYHNVVARRTEEAEAKEKLREERAKTRQEIVLKQLTKQAERARADRIKNLPKCNLRTAKKVANRLRKEGLLKTDDWNNDKFLSWHRARLLEQLEQKEFNSDKRLALQYRAKKEKEGKPVTGLDSVSEKGLVQWYRHQRNKRMLERARKAAVDAKHKAGFDPATTKPELLLFWYKLRMQLAAKKQSDSTTKEKGASSST
eukprot:GHVS01042068.1.p1 GENE.GHVS01042068.1~~GHVS01042068.1.p1  ORF type:complete len:530 (-),score=127.15 GHVS01042068.1:1649-3238(-)